MNLQRAAEIQAVLEGIRLPATREELVRYATREDAAAGRELERIPAREYGRIDEVAEQLVPTQPVRQSTERLPRPESGEPPGGEAYVQQFPESGAVHDDAPPWNPPQKAIEEQSATQKRQQSAQGS
jgi:Protein of unknown function (DUF2795)